MSSMKWFKYKAYFLYYCLRWVTGVFGILLPPIVSSSVIVERRGKILVIDLSYENGLALPGGVVERDETLEEAAVRETLEETGLKVSGLKYFNSYPSSQRADTINVIFTGTASGKLRQSKEGLPRWISPHDALEEFYYDDNIAALEEYLKK